MNESPQPAISPTVETWLVYAHGLAALVTLLISVAFGILASIELLVPGPGGRPRTWLTWGRLRYDHTQGIMLGWLGNAFFAFLYHAVPLLTGRRVTSAQLGQWIFGLWNFAVVAPGWILVLAGFSQPLEWAEFPLVIDAFVVLALVLAIVQFLPPFFSRGLEDLYVSSWYIIGALVFTLLAYPMGNFVPEFVPGARGAAFSGLWIHDAIGLFVTPLALAIIYFVIPAATRRPIFSHFLSMLGFWLLFFLYPLNGTHHYIFSVIPMSAQIGAITASTLLGVDVIIVVANLLLSLRGAGWFPRDLGSAIRRAPGTVFYLIVSIQGSVQAQMSVNQSVHFSDWVIGHSHLAMLGFATLRRGRRTGPRVAADSLGALQPEDARLGVLASARRRGGHGFRSHHRRIGGGAAVAIGRALDGFGSRRASLLAGPHAQRRPDRRRFHRSARRDSRPETRRRPPAIREAASGWNRFEKSRRAVAPEPS